MTEFPTQRVSVRVGRNVLHNSVAKSPIWLRKSPYYNDSRSRLGVKTECGDENPLGSDARAGSSPASSTVYPKKLLQRVP